MGDRENGGPAFPVEIRNGGVTPVSGFYGDSVDPGKATTYGGMSLRDYFAAKAVQGMSSAFDGMTLEVISESIPTVASLSYAMADAMLKERAK